MAARKKPRQRVRREAAGPAREPLPPKERSEAPPSADKATTEWERVEPTDKGLGMARLVLDKGVRTTAIGQLYGLDFEIEDEDFRVKLFFDRYSRRLKVLSYEATSYRALADRLSYLARANDFDKIFVKARRDDWSRFLALGFLMEGVMKYYFRGEDAFVLSKFLSAERLASPHLIEETALIEKLLQSRGGYEAVPLPDGYRIIAAGTEHIPQMVRLYRRVFSSYPSPLTHPDYIDQTMQRHVLYRVVENARGEVVSAASAEVDEANSTAELTDCATRASDRGKGLMYALLTDIEDHLRQQGIYSGYTLARATSVGMNRVFYRLGYEYSGRLINNCDIAGSYEDMNIWVKKLAREAEGEGA